MKHLTPALDQLPDNVLWLLQRTDGFLDMQMMDHACDEIQRVPEPYRENLLYQQILLRLTMSQREWRLAADLARELCVSAPNTPSHWVQLAYVIRRQQDIQSARTILFQALKNFPKEAVIPYNLACYECQLGDLGKARQYLDRAMKLNPVYREIALDDDDLEPLWDELQP